MNVDRTVGQYESMGLRNQSFRKPLLQFSKREDPTQEQSKLTEYLAGCFEQAALRQLAVTVQRGQMS